MVFEYEIKSPTDIKSFLLEKGFSIRSVNKLLLTKNVYVNGKRYDGDYNLKSGDKLKAVFSEESSVKPVDKPIEIVYEDEYFLVVNKPKGLITAPSKRHYEDSLSGRVFAYLSKGTDKSGVHAVNRLDIDTCGLVVFAKSGHVHKLLSETEITKKYRFTVKGILSEKQGVIDKNIERIEGSVKRCVSDSGKRAITKYKVIGENENTSVIEAELVTGRTHQIRVHFSSIGHPLVGDKLYGDGEGEFDLCSYSIAFAFLYNKKEYVFNTDKSGQYS